MFMSCGYPLRRGSKPRDSARQPIRRHTTGIRRSGPIRARRGLPAPGYLDTFTDVQISARSHPSDDVEERAIRQVDEARVGDRATSLLDQDEAVDLAEMFR